MAWDRKIEMIVGAGGTGLEISGLDVEFRVERSMKLSENFAQFKIYNAKASTRNEVLKKDNGVVFKAGYDDEGISTLFIGQIAQAISGKDGVDWVTDVRAVSSRGKNKKIDTIPLSLSYTAGTTIASVIRDVAQALGLVVNGASNATFRLLNGWVYTGTSNGALRYIQDFLTNEGLGLYFDNDELVVFKIGEASKFEIVYLTYTGGLLNVQDVTEPPKESQGTQKKRGKIPKVKKRVRYESLLIPQLQINAPVVLKGTSHDGTYINDKVTYEGDNFGGDFKCTGEAVA